MLYMITPPYSVRWMDDYVPNEILRTLLQRPDADFEAFDWKPVEHEQFGPLHLQIVLRRGHLNRSGIVIEMGELSRLRQIRQMRESLDGFKNAREVERRTHEPIMEHFAPGWAEDGRMLDAQVEASNRAVIEEAQAEVERVLAEEPKKELVTYWRNNGGVPLADY